MKAHLIKKYPMTASHVESVILHFVPSILYEGENKIKVYSKVDAATSTLIVVCVCVKWMYPNGCALLCKSFLKTSHFYLIYRITFIQRLEFVKKKMSIIVTDQQGPKTNER